MAQIQMRTRTKIQLAAIAITFVVGGIGLGRATYASDLQPPPAASLKTATFAGGCFWSMQIPFDGVPGVVKTITGYTGGSVAHADYEQVSTGNTGHLEAVQVVYDPAKVTYQKLLYVYWRNIDPLTKGGQFCDMGNEYHTAIFTADDEQKQAADASRAELQKRFGDRPVMTEIKNAGAFWRAEEYHQDYYKKNELGYRFYRMGCGRDARLQQVWGDEAGGGIKH